MTQLVNTLGDVSPLGCRTQDFDGGSLQIILVQSYWLGRQLYLEALIHFKCFFQTSLAPQVTIVEQRLALTSALL